MAKRINFEGYVIRIRQDRAGIYHARVTTRTAAGTRATVGAAWATKHRHAVRQARALVRHLMAA